jgi:hypothetical protein
MRQPPWTHERRRALRVDVPPRAAVDAQCPDVAIAVRLRQVSTSGILVEGAGALEPESRYDIRLAIAGHPALTLAGRVVHSRAMLALDADARVRFVSAITFERLSDDDATALATIVSSLSPDALDTGESES